MIKLQIKEDRTGSDTPDIVNCYLVFQVETRDQSYTDVSTAGQLTSPGSY